MRKRYYHAATPETIQFFQCKAFMYEEDIKVRPNAEVVEYSFK